MSTHEFIKELIDSGLTERQAEVIARHQTAVINESLATKQDVALLKQDIELLKKDLLLKLGSVMVGGFVVLSGIMLSVLSLLLN